MVEWTCPRCKRSFAARNARHACNRQSPEAMLAPFARMVPVYRAVRRAVEALGAVEVEATKTQIAFRARRRFAFLWVPALALRRGAPELFLAVALPRKLRSARVKQAVEARPGLWMHHVRVDRVGDVDAEVRAWLAEAFAAAAGAPRTRART